MLVDPANARLAAHLGWRLADYAVGGGADEDEARRARAEADFQTRRALKLNPDNEELKKLRADALKLSERKIPGNEGAPRSLSRPSPPPAPVLDGERNTPVIPFR